ncbi:MAG: MATE family efflux transporter [Anaerolineaceae bacterium]|nr:MATE family efflux transporter [Anaerolineaceae bacterium]
MRITRIEDKQRKISVMLKNFLSDKAYFSALVQISLPIIIQQFIMSSLNMVDVVMIGQLGETAIAAVGLSNQIFFLLGLLLFGISSGAAIFSAQYWGKKDITNIHKVLGVCVTSGVLAGVLFSIIALVFPETTLGIYTKDSEVIALGGEYLRIVGFCYVAITITFSYSAILRSTENVKLPMTVSIIALSLNTFINYLLIFGNLGFPEMGVRGAAIATLISRTFECTTLLLLTYIKKTPAAAKIQDLLGFVNRPFLKRYFKTTLPVVLNELTWSLGITTYSIVYARISTEALAAVNIAMTIENMAHVVFSGLGHASAIMIGKKIGTNEMDRAHQYAGRSITLAITGAVIMGGVIIASAGKLLTLYNISEISRGFAHGELIVGGFVLWIRASNMTIMIGVLRSGGDTRFAFVVELLTIWVVGVPLAFLGAFVFHLPVYWVYLLVATEELMKFIIGFMRFRSKKWINNLVQNISSPAVVEAVLGD